MKSKFLSLKSRATSLRKRGLSIRYIENKLGIPRSTLSGWLKDIKLSANQRKKLFHKWENGLIKARKKAVLVHNKGRNDRREKARQEVEKFVSNTDIDKSVQEIILAAFYLAEGGKTENSFALANSNPEILLGVITLLRRVFTIDESKFRCCLHLRGDQDENMLKEFWSKTLNIPESKFTKTQFDKRTVKKTYDHYKGVCLVNYFDMALQRRILYLGEKLLEIINKNTGA
jgi:transcriptional regulator with XRE-family HTH domain